MFDSKVKSLVLGLRRCRKRGLVLTNSCQKSNFSTPQSHHKHVDHFFCAIALWNWFTINYPKNSVADSAFAFSIKALFFFGRQLCFELIVEKMKVPVGMSHVSRTVAGVSMAHVKEPLVTFQKCSMENVYSMDSQLLYYPWNSLRDSKVASGCFSSKLLCWNEPPAGI